MNRFAIVVHENTTFEQINEFIEQQMIVTIEHFDTTADGIVLMTTHLDFAFDDIVDISFQMQATYVEWVKR